MRVTSSVVGSEAVRLRGYIPEWATNANNRGRLQADTHLENLHLILSRSPEVEAAFDQLLSDLYDPASPRFHQWLTPQQNATQYGIAPSDLSAVTSWLQSQGLQVDDVAAGGVFITFSGSASAIETAFSTSLHQFSYDKLTLRAPVQEPAVPAAIAGIIQSVAGLDDTRMKPNSRGLRLLPPSELANGGSQPLYTSGSGNHYLSPGDFNAIYDVKAAASAGYTGTGEHVFILGYAHVQASDISTFESVFNLGVTTQPNTLLLSGSSDPGYDGIDGWQGENTLDMERVLGTAPNASIDFSIAATSSYSNTYSQLQYNISTLNDPIVSMSFGSGESTVSSGIDTNFDTYFKTAAAQGISTFVSSGDTGAAGGDANGSAAPSTQYLQINTICASSYVTCVGGTEFSETTANAGTYWNATTNATTLSSAISYIPEGGWNETIVTSGEYYPAGSGGGVSRWITKPSYQTGAGVPADGYRDSPDVAFSAAANHDGYLLCFVDSTGAGCSTTKGFYVVGGTSASAPGMAGITALLDQKLGKAQGNLNPLLYGLATTAPSVFHDVTTTTSAVSGCVVTTPSMCNNSTPSTFALTGGLSGYLVATGYDQVTGLGSIDVNNLLTAVTPVTTPTFSVSPLSTALTLNAGATTGNTDVISVASVNSFAGAVAMTCSATNSTGTAAGTCSLGASSVTLTTGSTSTDTLTIATTAGTSGVLNVTVTGTSGSTVVSSSTIAVTVTAGTFTMSPNPATASVTSGVSGSSVVTLTSVNGFAGTVSVTCAGSLASGVNTTTTTCSASPSSVVLAANGTGMTTITIPTTSGAGGALTATISGSGIPTGGTVATSASTTVTITVTAPSITVFAASAALPISGTLVSGTNATDAITFSSMNGFAGTVTPACVVSGSVSPTPTCSFSPTTAVLTSSGTQTTTMTVTSTVGSSGLASISVTGSGTSTGQSVSTTSYPSANVSVTLTAPSFTLSPSPSSLSFISGATTGNTSTITLASVNGFNGTVALSCSVSTSSAYYQPHCAITPTTSGTVSTGTTQTATLSITSTAATTAMLEKPWVFGEGVTLALLFLVPAVRRRRTLRSLVALTVLFCGIAGLSGCGGASTPAAPTIHSSAGSYIVTISGSGTTAGAGSSTPAAAATTNVSVTIN